MDLRPITNNQKNQYNKLVTHVIQSWEWGEFRKSLGIPLLRYGLYRNRKLAKVFQLTLHKIPFTNKYVGYLPKGPAPDKELAKALTKIGKENNCAFIKIEPDVEMDNGQRTMDKNNSQLSIVNSQFIKSPKPLFTKYNFILDLTKSEEELLKNMHPKTRYNIKVAQKHGVKISETTDNKDFETYLKLYFETTNRQGYHGHNETYHTKVWQILKAAGMARLLIAFYPKPYTLNPTSAERRKALLIPLSAWMLLNFKDTLYYPYGGSSKVHPEVMANNLICWEAIKLGKKMGLKKFDMWGALGPDANVSNPWFGFHRFKQGYGGQLVEYLGTYDLVFNWPLYWVFTTVDKLMPLKVFLLKWISR